MKDRSKTRDRVRELLARQKLGVLATVRSGEPYASLVAFCESGDLREICFATTRATRKYENITTNTRAVLLADNRANRASDFHEAAAVTAAGTVEELSSPEKERYVALYLDKHPYLEDFVRSPSCALLKITVEKYSVVTRFQNVIELEMK